MRRKVHTPDQIRLDGRPPCTRPPLLDRFPVAGHHHGVRSVDRRHIHPVGQAWPEFPLRQEDRCHGAPTAQPSHHLAAGHDDLSRVLKRKGASNVAAATSPCEWPTTASGSTPKERHQAASATITAKSTGWTASAPSGSPCRRTSSTDQPASDSMTWEHSRSSAVNTGAESSSSRAIPSHWVPWPGKTKTGLARRAGSAARHARWGRCAAARSAARTAARAVRRETRADLERVRVVMGSRWGSPSAASGWPRAPAPARPAALGAPTGAPGEGEEPAARGTPRSVVPLRRGGLRGPRGRLSRPAPKRGHAGPARAIQRWPRMCVRGQPCHLAARPRGHAGWACRCVEASSGGLRGCSACTILMSAADPGGAFGVADVRFQRAEHGAARSYGPASTVAAAQGFDGVPERGARAVRLQGVDVRGGHRTRASGREMTSCCAGPFGAWARCARRPNSSPSREHREHRWPFLRASESRSSSTRPAPFGEDVAVGLGARTSCTGRPGTVRAQAAQGDDDRGVEHQRHTTGQGEVHSPRRSAWPA